MILYRSMILSIESTHVFTRGWLCWLWICVLRDRIASPMLQCQPNPEPESQTTTYNDRNSIGFCSSFVGIVCNEYHRNKMNSGSATSWLRAHTHTQNCLQFRIFIQRDIQSSTATDLQTIHYYLLFSFRFVCLSYHSFSIYLCIVHKRKFYAPM